MKKLLFQIIVMLLFASYLPGTTSEVTENIPSLPAFTPWKSENNPQTGFQNVRELTHLNEPELLRAMAFITETLSVKCMVCHLQQDFSMDGMPFKQEARDMIEMIQTINPKYFRRERVTCHTCHRERIEPLNLPEGISDLPSLVRSGQTAGPSAFRNVHRLTHLMADQHMAMMAFIMNAVGAENCFYCHNPADFSSDEHPKKLQAREMIAMIQEIQPTFFHEPLLTCYTCHRGSPEPELLPKNWKPGWD